MYFVEYANRAVVYNLETYQDLVENRPAGTPLVTVSNHTSCLDDPLLFGGYALVNMIFSLTIATHVVLMIFYFGIYVLGNRIDLVFVSNHISCVDYFS